MENVIKKLEELSNLSEDDILTKFEEIVPQDKSKISNELRSELMAFSFYEDRFSRNNNWGTYFMPRFVFKNKDGNIMEEPSIQLVNKEMIEYWQKRMNETKNPLLKARYAGLIWDFSKKILNQNSNYHTGLNYIDSLVDIIEKYDLKEEYENTTKVARALELSISLNNVEKIEKVKNAIFNLEKKLSKNNPVEMWGLSFDLLLMENKDKVNLTQEKENLIISNLEKRLTYFTSEKTVDFFYAEATVERLARYYRKNEMREDIARILAEYRNAYNLHKTTGSALEVHSWLTKVYQIHKDYQQKKEREELLVELRELGSRINDELHPMNISTKIPKEKFDEFVDFFTKGDKQTICLKIIQHFIPKKESIAEQMMNEYKNNPIKFDIYKSIMDEKGRVVATIGSLDDDYDGNLYNQISLNMNFSSIFLNAAFKKVIDTELLSEMDILNFIKESPVFEESRFQIILKAVKAYFDHDFIIAIHLLTPQIEEAIRNLIEISGGTVLKPSKNGGFQLKTLGDLIGDEIIKKVFGEDIQTYFLLLFTDQRGWNIRNSVCHGIVEDNFFSAQVADRLMHVLLIMGIVRNKYTSV